jgi:hypothetical protein
MSTFNNRFSPRLETLDERALMSCTVWADGSALTVIGDGGNDQVTIGDHGNGNVFVTATGAGTKSFSGIQSILVATFDGDDDVRYYLWNSLAGKQALQVGLGDGNDYFRAKLANGVDLLNGSRLNIRAIGDGADDSGLDLLSVIATGVDILGGKLTTVLEGGASNDGINQRYDGKLVGGKLYMNTDGGAGNDVVIQTMRCRPGSSGLVQTMVYGNAGNDTLSLYLYLQPAVQKQLAFLWGGAGNDNLAHNAAVTAAQ